VRTYLLDTNVVSEPAKPRPDAAVVALIAEHEAACTISAVTWHELRYGVGRLQHGRRRYALAAYVNLLPSRFPVLAYDARAADWHATLRVRDAAAGTVRQFADGQIAAIAVINSLTLITRNVADFSGIDDIALDSWHSDPASTSR
jgi:tRNA(fMet)-specific endonuclease VapC